MKWYLTVFVLCCVFVAYGQVVDSLLFNELQEVVISAYLENTPSETSLNIEPLKIEVANRYGSYNLTELLSKTLG